MLRRDYEQRRTFHLDCHNAGALPQGQVATKHRMWVEETGGEDNALMDIVFACRRCSA